VNFDIRRGEKIAIVGPSGSGKSTLLALLGLLDTPTTGTITIEYTEVGTLGEREQAQFRNEHIGFVFQSFELIEPFTVRENIAAPLDIGKKRAEEYERIDTLTTRVGLTERVDALPYTLSGGEKQRVAIARALIHRPSLILADEPTGSLDRATGARVLSLLLEEVEEAGSTLMVITHDETVAERMDRVFELRDRSLHERT
jgi:ABC-type lipoprotein export system ATPase subunit